MKFKYYYNDVPGIGKCRNNLIYTSLISEDQKTFVQWYYNDTEYHKGKNQVINPELMDIKWSREITYLKKMQSSFPDLVPEIIDIDYTNKKIYLKIDGPDFWERSNCDQNKFDLVIPDWKEQMIEIFKAHRSLNLYKYSLHPSSYFIINGKLKSINYFFTYKEGEEHITVKDHLSHISSNRQEKMKLKTEAMGIDWEEPQSLLTMQLLALESFRADYPDNFIDTAKGLYV